MKIESDNKKYWKTIIIKIAVYSMKGIRNVRSHISGAFLVDVYNI